MKRRTLLLSAAFAPLALLANNIVVSNVSLTGQNTTNDTYQVVFDVTWANSWRTSTAEANYDAAWIFIKFRVSAGPWQHAVLNSSGGVVPSGATVTIPTDLRGAFLFRNANGIGTVNFTGAQLQWNYGTSGVADNAVVEVRVLAIEMVFIPQGAFFVGDGTTTSIQQQFELGQTGAPFQVTSEAAITLGGAGANNLNARNGVGNSSDDDFTYTLTQTLPAAWPKGFSAFYAMKYEATEGQYVDFLNMLTTAQATARFPNAFGSFGNTINNTGTPPDIYTTNAPERACNSVGGFHFVAYADWAGLRPMTEFEWEKTARGNLGAVPDEYAWGSANIHGAAYTITNAALANEATSNPGAGTSGNAIYTTTTTVLRPYRAGIFAGSLATPTRVQAGAGYYGAMELTGNVDEHTITPGSPTGRAFTGNNGDGALDATGNANVTSWPTTGLPLTGKGGNFALTNTVSQLTISGRRSANIAIGIGTSGFGIRLCRLP